MASMHPPLVLAPYSPSLPEFETDLSRLRDTQYLGTLEVDLEHSRDLYLQGAMAIGQIARLLEELCADYEPENTEGVIESVPFEDASYATSVNYQERKNILAWAQTVSRYTSLKNDGSTVGADVQAQECREEIHIPESSVVDDMSVIEDHINGIHEDVTNGTFPTRPTMQVSTTTLLETADEKQFDLALRISNLSARLDRLGADIDEFSNERCDALTRLEAEIAAEEELGSFGAYGNRVPVVDTLECRTPSFLQEDLPFKRIWNVTATTTSSFSPLLTPPDVEEQPLQPDSAKACFWSHA